MVRRFLVVLAVVVGTLGLTACPGLSNLAPQPSSTGCDTNVVVVETNVARANAGLGNVKVNGDLTESAAAHSTRMANGAGLTHDGWVDEIRAAGYGNGTLGQNVAYGYSASNVVDGWMGSPGHRANILNGVFTDIGVGCVNRNGTLWWTQNFGGA